MAKRSTAMLSGVSDAAVPHSMPAPAPRGLGHATQRAWACHPAGLGTPPSQFLIGAVPFTRLLGETAA